MFTGIIESIGTVRATRPGAGGKVISVDLGRLSENVNPGDSIAINGVCLTVSKINCTVAEFDVSTETLEKSAMDKITSGATVNIERAMAADGRFGGHIVQGHIDGVGTIKAINKIGDFAEITFTVDSKLLDELITKGSVAIDGISLTVAKMDKSFFTISVIPTTLKETTLGSAKIGNVVNIETDVIIKTVKKQLQKILPTKEGLTQSKLKELGF